MKKQLKACLFCGGEVKVFKETYLSYGPLMGFPYYAGCSEGSCCPIQPRTAWCQSEEDAIKAWQNVTKKHSAQLTKYRRSSNYYFEQTLKMFNFLERRDFKIYKELLDFLNEKKSRV